MTELEIQIASIDNQIEALKTKRIELLNKLPKTNLHPDTFDKPYFVIVPVEVGKWYGWYSINCFSLTQVR